MFALSDCVISEDVIESCTDIVITDAHVSRVEKNTQALLDAEEDLPEYPPVDTQTVTLPPGQGCIVTISSSTTEEKMGGFQITTRDEEILGVITTLTDGEFYNSANTNMFSPETKDFTSDVTGNVYVKHKMLYHVTLFNTAEEDEKSVTFELQNATTLLASAAGLLALTHLF